MNSRVQNLLIILTLVSMESSHLVIFSRSGKFITKFNVLRCISSSETLFWTGARGRIPITLKGGITLYSEHDQKGTGVKHMHFRTENGLDINSRLIRSYTYLIFTTVLLFTHKGIRIEFLDVFLTFPR